MSTTSTASADRAARRASTKAARRMGRSPSETPAGWLTYVTLVVTLALFAFPLYWMFIVASSTDEELAQIPPSLLPSSHLMDNIKNVFTQDNIYFLQSLVNTVIVATIVSASVLLLCSLAGFAFAKLKFKGRNVLMALLLATLAVPPQLGIVPLFILMTKLGWTGQLTSVIVPGLVTAFGVFYMRQYIVGAVPDELIESARVDGASTVRIYASIVLPSIRPALGVLGLLTFLATWNDFQWPLVTLSQGTSPTVQVALSNLASGQFIVYSHVLAGALLATIPLVVIFIIAGKQLVTGIMEGAVKG